MFEPREVDYSDIYLETSKIRLGERFVEEYDELRRLPEEAQRSIVDQVARMATAAEIYIFDREIDANHMNCQVYATDDGDEKGILLFAVKTEDGVVPKLAWVSAEDLMTAGYTFDQLRALGFSLMD